jgi:hypothetical protein
MLVALDVEVGVFSGEGKYSDQGEQENEYQTNEMTGPILHH